MHSVTLVFTQGPMKGESMQRDLGALTLGREPSALEPGQMTVLLRGADGSVSRNHATLLDEGGRVLLRNVSGNGTLVDGKLVLEDAVLRPGSKVKVGSSHEFVVEWQVVGAAASKEKSEGISTSALMNAGPLASPVVRAVLVVYLGGLLAILAWLMLGSSGDLYVADDWPELEQAYASYETPTLSNEERARRLAFAQQTVSRVRVLRIKERSADVHKLCRELMSLEADINSPIYRYGAKCLGSF